jgi:hypothetical protein
MALLPGLPRVVRMKRLGPRKRAGILTGLPKINARMGMTDTLPPGDKGPQTMTSRMSSRARGRR